MKRVFVFDGIAVGAVVVVIIVAAIFIFSSLDSIVQAAVEKFGTEIVGANVSLADVEISPTSGERMLRGLKVGTPVPFKTDSAFSLGEVSVAIDPATITGGTIVIKEILVSAPEGTYELGNGSSNIDAIQKNVENYLGPPDGSGSTQETTAKDDDDGEGTKLVIENLIIRGGKIKVSATLLKGKTLDASLPDIHLKDIGKEEGGTSPGDVVEKVVASLKAGIGTGVAGLDIEGLLGGVGDAAKKATEGLKSGVEGAASAVQGSAEKVGGGLKSCSASRRRVSAPTIVLDSRVRDPGKHRRKPPPLDRSAPAPSV